MKYFVKILLILELFLGFGFTFLIWVLGILTFTHRTVIFPPLADFDMGIFFIMVVLILGGLGIWGMLQLAAKVILGSSKVTSPSRLKKFLASGYIANLIVLGFFLSIRFGKESLMVGLSLVVAIHFTYLGREYLWQKNKL